MPKSKRVLGSNLARLDATTDEDIARQIAEDPDTAPELTDEELDEAEVWHGNRYLGRGKDVRVGRMGRPPGSGTKEQVTLRLDRRILDHFRASGPGWQTRLNDALLGVVTPLKVGTRIGGATVIAVKTLRAKPVNVKHDRAVLMAALEAGKPVRLADIKEVFDSASLRPAARSGGTRPRG